MESQISEMEKNQSLLIHADDLKGSYSVSEFISLMPSQLSWVDNKSISHLKIFCSQGHHTAFNNNKGTAATREKIKSALEGLDIFHFPTLVQLWMPKTLGSQQFLVTSHLPFGINLLRKGLCMYRKLCLDYKYDLDCEEELGPVGRVFRNGVPEFGPYVNCYSTKEFRLRDRAVSCGVCGYLAWPVFESAGNQCFCVLELITVWDGNYYLTDAIKKVAEAIKAVGLRSYNAHWPLDIERSSQREFALSEIEKGLKVVCHTHNIHFAQTWVASPGENHIGSVMSTSEKGSIMSAKKVSSFQKDCIQFGLRKGQSVAWTAFASCSSWFCKDVKQLNINEYPLVLSARKVDLTACFAICLRSTSTGNGVYVLELFLPSYQTFYRRPQTLLNSILVAVKEQFRSFKVASIQEPGADIFDASIPEEKHLHINQTINWPPAKRKADHSLPHKDVRCSENYNAGQARYTLLPEEDTTSVAHPASQAAESETKIMFKSSFKEDIIKFQLSISSGIMDFVNEVNKRLKLTTGSFEIKYQNEDNNCISLTSDADFQNLMSDMMSQKKNTVKVLLEPVRNQHLEEDTTSVAHPASQAAESEAKIMFKASFKDDIIKFQLSLSSGIMDFVNEVKKRLNLSTGSFEIKYQNEDNNCFSLASDADLQNLMFDMMSQGKNTVKVLLEPVQNQHLEEDTTSVAHPASQAAESEAKIMFKASFKDDIIKFQLSLSSGILDFVNEVKNRLKLTTGSFEIRYQNEENNCFSISSDADLQNLMFDMMSQRKNTVKVLLEPVQNQNLEEDTTSVAHPASQAAESEAKIMFKASFKDDIIKFQLSLSSGILDFVDEVNKRLKLTTGSFEIKYQNEDSNCISLASDADLQNLMFDMMSQKKNTVKVLLEPVQNQNLEEDTTSVAHPASQAAESEAKIMFKASFKDDIIKFQLSLSSGILDFVDEVNKRLKLTTGSFEIKYQNEDSNCISLASDADLQNLMFDMMSQKKNTVKVLLEPVQNQHLESSRISVACPVPRTMPMQNQSTVTILATYKEETVNFELSLLSGFQELNGQLMKRLKLTDDSFQIMSLGDANKWMPVASDIDLHTCMDIAKSQDKPTIRLAVKPFTNQLPGGVSTSVSPPTPQAMTNQNESLMSIKAIYKGDIVKFQLPSQSGLMQLKDAVTKRLKLSSDSFEVKYQDEDSNWIYISKDADLQNHLNAMRLSDRLTVKLHLSP